jgi:dephospho-CoA kinase
MVGNLKSTLLLFLAILAFAPAHSESPKIVYLKGSCSSGKTTLIRSMEQRWNNLTVVDEDSMVHKRFPEAVAERFPFEYPPIATAVAKENLYRALRTQDLLFKSNATREECLEAKRMIDQIQHELDQLENLPWYEGVMQSIRDDIVKAIQAAIREGNHVVIDSWYFTASQIQEHFPEVTTLRVMVYSPLAIAYERLLQRNQEALLQENLDSKRDVNQLVSSFCSIYQLSARPSQPIEAISWRQLNQLFDSIYSRLGDQEWQRKAFVFGELSRSQFRTIQTQFMQPYAEHGATVLYVSPREDQDLIIDNTARTPQQALDLLEGLLQLQ